MTMSDEWLRVESIDIEAQGVAHDSSGKVVFIDGALPGEDVQVDITRRKPQWEQGNLRALRSESALRVRPRCPHFGLHAGSCGGCKMQHLDAAAQVAVKQRALEDNLAHLAKVKPERVLRPIEGPPWGYRYRARLSVRHVPRKGGVLVGFHERKSRYVADMTECHVLPPKVAALLVPLRLLIGSMDQRDRLPQIEVAVGDLDGAPLVVLVLRHLEPLSAGDAQKLRAFGREHAVHWWLQPKGPETVHPLVEDGPELAYSLREFDLRMPFRPTDFTQVNPMINAALVGRALRLLEVSPAHRVIDWFCGLGNFTLPIARTAHAVLGIEGSDVLVQRSRENAARNGLAERAQFVARNLFEITVNDLQDYGSAERWLVDPPREGAFALVKALAEHRQAGVGAADDISPQRIVYVSCNPATLARDAGLLVHQAGYRCVAAGVVNMFPHTAHVESIAVFDRG
ncbi:MAG: 23S rRNA (uracil(1939)-C(5))-methyltransferase RlmD [Burkholderiaceae bacterium]|nr:23S rRNA (uracil(1939)-C(5))-methyltransferase RlmD [Aquabacterium sp.]NUP84146.1 23S rRNA (uracil(1939)-C(5))-methyltransferase RlmD [Burkholderiaceae bacterium]